MSDHIMMKYPIDTPFIKHILSAENTAIYFQTDPKPPPKQSRIYHFDKKKGQSCETELLFSSSYIYIAFPKFNKFEFI